MEYYWIIDNNRTYATTSWIVYDSSGTDWSIANFFTDLDTYLTSGSLFGLTKFGLSIIVFLFIFIFTGIMAYKYGLTSPIAIISLVFFVVVFLDWGVKIIPPVNDAIPHFPSLIMGIILIATIVWENVK